METPEELAKQLEAPAAAHDSAAAAWRGGRLRRAVAGLLGKPDHRALESELGEAAVQVEAALARIRDAKRPLAEAPREEGLRVLVEEYACALAESIAALRELAGRMAEQAERRRMFARQAHDKLLADHEAAARRHRELGERLARKLSE